MELSKKNQSQKEKQKKPCCKRIRIKSYERSIGKYKFFDYYIIRGWGYEKIINIVGDYIITRHSKYHVPNHAVLNGILFKLSDFPNFLFFAENN